MRTKDWAVALTLALCLVGLVACGGGSSPGGGDASASNEEAKLEFAECMRAHGIEVEDPKPGKSMIVGGDGPGTKKALAACNGKLGDAGQEVSAGKDEEINEGALAFAKCMREEGIQMGDPEILGPGKFHLDLNGIDPNSPAFKAAQEACGEKLPELDVPGVGG